jgi:hypothetical protein
VSTPKILSLALCASAALCWLAPERVEAGVIVLHNGKVFVGRIRPEEDGKRQVTGVVNTDARGRVLAFQPAIESGKFCVHDSLLFRGRLS